MPPTATIYDVAARAGVSISTVSLALNSPGRVKEQTLLQIHAAIDELGFVPKAEAVTRARRGVGRIGVVAPFSTYPSFHRRLDGVLSRVRNEGIEAVVYDHEGAATSLLREPAAVAPARRADRHVAAARAKRSSAAWSTGPHRPCWWSSSVPASARSRSTTVGASSSVAEHLSSEGTAASRSSAKAATKPHPHDRVLQSEARIARLPRRRSSSNGPSSSPPAPVRLVRHSLGEANTRPPASCSTRRGPPDGGLRARQTSSRAASCTPPPGARPAVCPRTLAVVGFDDSELAEHLGLTSVRQPFEAVRQDRDRSSCWHSCATRVAAAAAGHAQAHPGRAGDHVTLVVPLDLVGARLAADGRPAAGGAHLSEHGPHAPRSRWRAGTAAGRRAG